MRFYSKVIFCCLFFLYRYSAAEESFLLVNGTTSETLLEFGSEVNKRMSPCSTFKIALSLMGLDAKILKDTQVPVWNFNEGYPDDLEVWKGPQTPRTWIRTSCVWYSQILISMLGTKKAQNYLAVFEYGNQDLSGELQRAWLSSSLKISPKEQVGFIQKMVGEKLAISAHAFHMTKALLFVEKLSERWMLFGKTGWSGPSKDLETGWFVGWIEKGDTFFPFAYVIRDERILLDQRISRVKQLWESIQVLERSEEPHFVLQ